MSDADVVHRVLAGDHEAFGGLVERHYASIFALCMAYVRNRAEAEDAAQETFVRSYERLDSLRKPARFPAWLATIARNVCTTRLQSSAREHEVLSDYAQAEVPRHRPTEAERLEMRDALRDLIDGLPPKTREAVYLYYIEQKSLREIGDYLGKSPNAVARLLKYGREVLKDRLWDEAADSLKDLRPKRSRVVAALAAIPLGSAPWCGATAALTAGAGTAATLGGGLLMSSKSVVLGLVVAAAVAAGLAWWHPWSVEPASLPQHETAAAKHGAASTEPAPHTPPPSEAVNPRPSTRNAETASSEPPGPKEPAESDEAPAPTTASAVISGYVSNDQASPVADAAITVEISSDRHGVDVVARYTAKAGADGVYAVNGIDVPGSAFVYASSDGYVMGRASTHDLKPGATVEGVDIVLSPAAHIVAGRVLGQSRTPAAGARVLLRYYGYDEVGLERTAATGQTMGAITSGKFCFAETDTQGRFQIALSREGLCDFTVTHEDYGPGFFPKVMTGTTDAEFVLRAHGGLAGRVTNDDGTPVVGARLGVVGEALPGNLPFTKTRIQAFCLKTQSAVTDERGAYQVEGLGEDYLYTVRVVDAPSMASGQTETVTQSAAFAHIASRAREYAIGDEAESSCLAQTRGIRVYAGQTTQGVDFVLGDSSAARVHGTVTDPTNGSPVHGLTICADLVDGEGDPYMPLGDATVTAEDGSYELRLSTTETHRFRICYWYLSENGSPGFAENAEVAQLDLGPGDNETLDFTAPAPLIVPVRYVNRAGEPAEGVMAGMRLAGERHGWGGRLSDAEGRVMWHGIDPARAYEALAWLDTPDGHKTIAESEPFTGQPGETVPEIVLVCGSWGGIEGVLVGSDGQPVGDREIGYAVRLEDGTLLPNEEADLGADGTFCILGALPEGVHPVVLVGRQVGEDQFEFAVVENVEISRDAVTNFGTLQLKPMSMEEAAALLGVPAS